MLRRVIYVSQRQAEVMRGTASRAIISITDPGAPLAKLRPGWRAVLRVAFHDVDSVTFPGANPELQPMTVAQAASIDAFLQELPTGIATLVVHCRHGVSRSAAVAKAIADDRHLHFPADCKDFNRAVHRLLSGQLSKPYALSAPIQI